MSGQGDSRGWACPPQGGAGQGGDAPGRDIGVEVGHDVRFHLGPVLLQLTHNGGPVSKTNKQTNKKLHEKHPYNVAKLNECSFSQSNGKSSQLVS